MKLPGPAEWLFSARTFGVRHAGAVCRAGDGPRPALLGDGVGPISRRNRCRARHDRRRRIARLGTPARGGRRRGAGAQSGGRAAALLSLALAGWVGVCLYFRAAGSHAAQLCVHAGRLQRGDHRGFPASTRPGRSSTRRSRASRRSRSGSAARASWPAWCFRAPWGRFSRHAAGSVGGANAQRWCLDALSDTPANAATRAERRRMAADIAEDRPADEAISPGIRPRSRVPYGRCGPCGCALLMLLPGGLLAGRPGAGRLRAAGDAIAAAAGAGC